MAFNLLLVLSQSLVLTVPPASRLAAFRSPAVVACDEATQPTTVEMAANSVDQFLSQLPEGCEPPPSLLKLSETII